MTTTPRLDDLLPIALDMSASLTSADRAQRLVDAVMRALPCDAAVLLRLDGRDLVPLAARGVSADVLGRRFSRDANPRLDIICNAPAPTVFPAASPLPDPYDGLIGGLTEHRVHSCAGLPLVVEGVLVGALTVDALTPGAFDGIEQGFLTHLAALAAAALRTAALIHALEQHSRRQGIVVRDMVKEALDHQGGLLIGRSERLARLRREIDLVARSEFPVLVSGETGVGKELVVRMLHSRSARADQPLVYVNCAALPESIAESELFGHKKGAFTSADEDRLGKLRVADGATLFLDEIGELPLHIQPKLLRALQEGEVQAVGADRPIHVDVRILAATNRNLEAEMAAGRFRADLFHRLDVGRIEVPALREHAQDIPELAGHFADRARQRLGTGSIRISPDAQAALMRGSWPGNVRELENQIYRAVLRASGRAASGTPVVVRAADVGEVGAGEVTPARLDQTQADVPAGLSLREAVQEFQRRVIKAALREHRGNWAAAARALGMHRSNLFHMAGRLGLDDDGTERSGSAAPDPPRTSGK
ncbi:MAG: nitric oxide reductase transcriptional regulator NorR [Deltaproteobacteria bacterium]|nr:nitric oxide reductase transcriptional regulator NorR [Deltaproteobacteria bacterium]